MRCVLNVCGVLAWAAITFCLWGLVAQSQNQLTLPERHSATPGALRPAAHVVEPSTLPEAVARAIRARYAKRGEWTVEPTTRRVRRPLHEGRVRDPQGTRPRIECDSRGPAREIQAAD